MRGPHQIKLNQIFTYLSTTSYQCDQIGQFLKVLGDKVTYKNSQNKC